MNLAALQTGLGTGQTTTGETLSVREALRIAGEAEIVPTVCAAGGRPLHLGRTRRLATTAQTFALVARDGGCSFPGCDVRPEWCDRHHIQDWLSGGPTDIDNLTLLCRYHHTNFAATAGHAPSTPPDYPPGNHPDRRTATTRRCSTTACVNDTNPADELDPAPDPNRHRGAP